MNAILKAVALGLITCSTLRAQAPVWTLSSEPTVQIGAVDAEPEYLLHWVAGVLRLSDGRVVIGDANGLRYYSAQGRFLSTAAVAGRGPGEYRYIGHLAGLDGDTVLIWDSVLRAQHIIAPEPRYVEVVPVRGTFPDTRLVSFEFSHLVSRTRMLSWPQPPHPEQVGQVERAPIRYLLAELSTGQAPLLGTYKGTVDKVLGTGPGGHARQPFSPRTYHAVGGDRIYIGDSAGREIHVFDSIGTPMPAITLDRTPERVLTRHLDAERSRIMARVSPQNRALAERNWAEAPKPDAFPFFSGLFADSSGRLWVKDYQADPDQESQWTILDENGRELGRLTLPARFTLMSAAPDHVAGVWRDDLDVEYAQVWRVQR